MSLQTLQTLPIELLYYISKSLDGRADLSSWSRSCRAFHAALTPLLYFNVRDDPVVMCWACDEDRVDTVQRLLAAGANPNTAWTQGKARWQTLRDLNNVRLSPWQLANVSGFFNFDTVSQWMMEQAAIRYEMAQYFHKYYFDIPDSAVDNRDDLDWEGANPYTVIRTFPQRCYWTPLHIAAAWGNDKLVNLLLDNGADINAYSRLFCKCAMPPDCHIAPLWTPLHTSMCHGHESTTRLLLSRGASTNITTRHHGQDKHRFTALHSACMLDLLDAARALVDGGYQTDVGVWDHKQLTPFAYAFFRGNWALIDFLLEHGADINAKIGPLTALGHACLLGYYAEALRLLDLGATPQCELDPVNGLPVYFHLIAVAGAPAFRSPRSSEQKEFRLKLVKRLIENGIDVNQRGAIGTTALMEAASFLRVDVVRVLLDSGAHMLASDRSLSGSCALEKAISLNSKESQWSPKGAMLDTVRALLEVMDKSPAPRLVDIEAMDPSANESDTTDDVIISIAFRSLCSLRYDHVDKVEVAALLLKYTKAVEMAKVGSNLVFATIRERNYGVSTLLLKNGFKRPCKKQLKDLILQSIHDNNAAGLRYILNCFPRVAPRIRSARLLRLAVSVQSSACTQFLIEEGVSINTRNNEGSSLLLTACEMGDTDTAEVLLDNGADPDECTPEGDPLTIVAALEADLEMVQLLLKYGASIHSSPPGKLTRHPDMGFLDIAIKWGLTDVVEEIVSHMNYGSPTDKEISRHWWTIIDAPNQMADDQFDMIQILLRVEGFDPDQIFTVLGDEPDNGLLTTPLHLCARFGLPELIEDLIINGAHIHKCLFVTPNSQTYIPKPEPKMKGWGPYEGTTPFGWAIEFSSIEVVRALRYGDFALDCRLLEREEQATKKDLMLQYAQAACRRQKPEMLSVLFNTGLDPGICDENGNTMIHMICDYVEGSWPDDDPEKTMECIADQAALSLITCLEWDVTDKLRNRIGVSGMDRVLQILKYSGNSEFHQILAKHWLEKIDYIEGSSPRLIAKIAAPDYDDESDGDYLYEEESSGDEY